jgi:rhodanese-related sulfurtransferase
MEFVALAIAVVALVVAFLATSRAKQLVASIEDARSDTRRQARNVAEALRRELFIVQQYLLRMVSGEELTPDMVREGLLWREIDVDEAKRMLADNPNLVVVDVRPPDETREGVIPGAKCIPVNEIDDRKDEIPKTGQPVLVYCAGGGRSLGVCEELAHQGFERLHNLSGGFLAWDGPVEKPSESTG